MDTPKPIEDLRAVKIHRRRRIWQPFMEQYDCQVIAELGVFTGENFIRMTGHKPQVAVAVDAWYADPIISRNDSGFSQEQKESQYEGFKTWAQDKPFVKICRGYTFDVVKQFPDEYFDLIYIDADHTYEGCKRDLEDWYPKVKTGKFFTGDDYREANAWHTGVPFGVIQAVDEFAQKINREVYELPRHGWAIIK